MATAARARPGSASRPRVTIAQVADALTLTKGTVSRALNGYPDISDATRNRVLRAVERMGYQPLSHAQAIRTGRSRAIGLVIQFGDHDVYRPFLAEFLAGLSAGAKSEGWTLTVTNSDSVAETLEAFLALKAERKADGFVLPRTLIDDPRVATLRHENIPFVMFGRTRNTEGCAWYDIEGEAAMADAVEHLVELGHRRIAHVPGGTAYTYSGLRLEGFRTAMAAQGLSLRDSDVAASAVTQQEGEAALDGLLAQPEPPTAIVCATDMAALGVLRRARAHGLSVPGDLSVTGYDGVPEGAHAEPPLTTYAVDHRRAGDRLARLLVARIRGAAAQDLRTLDRARFVNRGSTAAPRTLMKTGS